MSRSTILHSVTVVVHDRHIPRQAVKVRSCAAYLLAHMDEAQDLGLDIAYIENVAHRALQEVRA